VVVKTKRSANYLILNVYNLHLIRQQQYLKVLKFFLHKILTNISSTHLRINYDNLVARHAKCFLKLLYYIHKCYVTNTFFYILTYIIKEIKYLFYRCL